MSRPTRRTVRARLAPDGRNRVYIPSFSSLDPIVTRRELRRIHVDRIARESEIEIRSYQHRERQSIRRLIRELANGYPFS